MKQSEIEKGDWEIDQVRVSLTILLVRLFY